MWQRRMPSWGSTSSWQRRLSTASPPTTTIFSQASENKQKNEWKSAWVNDCMSVFPKPSIYYYAHKNLLVNFHRRREVYTYLNMYSSATSVSSRTVTYRIPESVTFQRTSWIQTSFLSPRQLPDAVRDAPLISYSLNVRVNVRLYTLCLRPFQNG